MSLEFKNVDIRIRGNLTPSVLRGINFRVAPHDRAALLCPNPAGISGIIDLISGAKPLESGSITRSSRISWPIPGTGFFHRHLNFIANARFLARLYEVDENAFIEQVIRTADLEDIAEERIDRCPKAATTRFAFALGVSLPFEIYLFTNTNIGDRDEREKYQEIIAELGERSGLILATTSAKAAQSICDRAFLIDGRTTHVYHDLEEAAEHLDRLTKGAVRKSPESEDEWVPEAEEERGFNDF